MDGIESIHPLALRPQDLFQKPEVLHRQRELPGAAFQEHKFIRSPLASAGMSDHEETDGRFAPNDRSDYKLPNLLGGQALGRFNPGFCRPLDDGNSLFPQLRDFFADWGKAGIAQELSRQSG